MSKNLIVLFIIILLIVGGFGIYSYDQANQAKKEVEEKTKLEALSIEKEETIETLKQQKDESAQIIFSKEELITNLKTEVKLYQEQIKELDSTVLSLKKEVTSNLLAAEAKRMVKLEEKDLFIARLKEEIENSSEKIKELNFTITELKDKLAKQEGAINQQDLVKRLNQLIIEKENIQKNVDAYEIMIEKLKNEKIELEQKLAEEESKPIYYYVTKEDSLWKIAKRFYNQGIKWIMILEANLDKIDNPDLIYPTQRLIIPKE